MNPPVDGIEMTGALGASESPAPSKSKWYLLLSVLLLGIIGISLYYVYSHTILQNIFGHDETPHEKKHEKPHHIKKPEKKKPDKKHAAKGSGGGTPGGKVHESFVSKKHDKDLCDKPRFVNADIVDDYRLSATVKSDRGNSCLKNCVTDKDHDFVASGAPPKDGEPVSFIDSGLEYSNFNAVCSEPAQNYCGSNAQVISKYSPGGLLMVEQNEGNLTTNSGLGLNSAVIAKPAAPVHASSDDEVVEHFAAQAAVELVLIVFLASWCPHCKDAKPHLSQFKRKHHNEQIDGVNVKVIEYDADVHKDEVRKYNVSGYPTYKLLAKYKDGSEKVHDHEGGRLYDDLLSLCKRHL